MGEKGRWLSAFRRVFSSKLTQKSADPKSSKEKKKKRKKDVGKFNGELSFRMYDEISSIERILNEAEREHNLIFRPPSLADNSTKPPPAPPKAPSPDTPADDITPVPIVSTPTATSNLPPPPPLPPPLPPPRVTSTAKPTTSNLSSGKKPHRPKSKLKRPEPSLKLQNASATKIQALYRGFMARKSFRSLKGLVRLQGVVKGQSVKRQTLTAMKYMQLLVRLQFQVQARRIQSLEHNAQSKEITSTGKWSLTAEAINVDWDDSRLTKEENDARIQRKAEAVMNRERARAYAYSNQTWRPSALKQPSQEGNIEMRWLNWLERQLAATKPTENQPKKNLRHPPSRPQLGGFDETDSPRSTRSAAPAFLSSRQTRTPMSRTLTPRTRLRESESPSDLSLKDDASLTSCPPYIVRSYLAPTVSAKAKEKPNSPASENRRLSFPLPNGFGSVFSGSRNPSSRRQSINSIGNLSVESASSMPVTLERKPFNRFV